MTGPGYVEALAGPHSLPHSALEAPFLVFSQQPDQVIDFTQNPLHNPKTLKPSLQPDQVMSEALAQFYFRQIVAGLACLHSQNVVGMLGGS